ncbi:MAG: hypothetical protein RXR82_00415 [Nitrososphaeria archaeon]
MSSRVRSGRVSEYLHARWGALKDNVHEIGTKIRDEGVVATAAELVGSVLGLLPTTDLGKDFANRRIAARKILVHRS